MKLTAIAGAIALALNAMPAQATADDSATILALDTCRQIARGLSNKEAFSYSADVNWPVVKDWVITTGSAEAARQVIRQQMKICPDSLMK
jgi:hypothetical protein